MSYGDYWRYSHGVGPEPSGTGHRAVPRYQPLGLRFLPDAEEIKDAETAEIPAVPGARDDRG